MEKEVFNEVEKFHKWLEKLNNIHIANMQSMDRAYLIIEKNVKNLKKTDEKFAQV